MAILYLIRHCEPELRGVFLGQIDSPLSTAGHQHAARAFAGIEVEVVWCSPLTRATETAAYFRAAHQNVLSDLREIDYGEWSGRTWSEIETGWCELAKLKSADWNSVAGPGGESWADFSNRVRAAWARICKDPRPAAVVAHLGVNAVLAGIILQRDPLQFQQRYGEVIRVEYD